MKHSFATCAAAVALDNVADNRQTKAQTAMIAGAGRFQLREPFEDPFKVLGGDAFTVVTHIDLKLTGR